jgi:hypothetical protein
MPVIVFLAHARVPMRVKRHEPERTAFFIGQMNGNGVALNHSADYRRRGTKKLTKLQVGYNLAGEIKEAVEACLSQLLSRFAYVPGRRS